MLYLVAGWTEGALVGLAARWLGKRGTFPVLQGPFCPSLGTRYVPISMPLFWPALGALHEPVG